MKQCLLLMLLIAASGPALFAQNNKGAHIQGPHKGVLPFWIVRSHHHEYHIDTLVAYKKLNPDWIKTIDIIKDSVSYKRFGLPAKKEAILVTLDDEKYPLAFNKLKGNLTQLELIDKI